MRWYACPAKVNLVLRVGPPRDDGFHPVVSLMTALDLRDHLGYAPGPGPLRLVVEDPGPGGEDVPHGEDNLVLRAARLFAARVHGAEPGGELRLRKAIPSRAGLGGGSADAAGALVALRDAHRPEIPDAELRGWAGDLGADVPFALMGGDALAEGKGERLEPVAGRSLPILLARPPGGIGTAEAYRTLDATRAGRDVPAPDAAEVRAVSARLAGGAPPGELGLGNDMDLAAAELEPRCAALAGAMRAAGAAAALLCGSGSAVAGIFAEAAARDAALAELDTEELAWGPHAAWTGAPGVREEEPA